MGGNIDVEGFSKAVGEDNVATDPDRLKRYGAPGGDATAEAWAVLTPAGMRELRDVILEARRTGANLVLRSSSTRGYRGDSHPSEDAVIVDLSQMNEVLRVDRRNKVAYIEAGVTFPALIEAAGAAGLKVLKPLLPRAGKSVLASCLEREPVVIPKYHWDMTDPLLCTEMVFGSGDLHRTGTAGSPGTIDQQIKAGLAHKNPMGPGASDFVRMVQGSQGTLAGVTWATVKLEVEPSLRRIMFATSESLSSMVEFTYSCLKSRVGDEWLLFNSRGLAGIIGADPESIDSLAEEQAAWTAVCGVSGYRYLPEERLQVQGNELSRRAQSTGVRLAPAVPGCTGNRMKDILSAPSPEPYFKTLPRGAFKEIFFLATLGRVGQLLDVMQEECVTRGYPAGELGVYVQPIQQGRTAHVEFNLYYDPDDEAAASATADIFRSASAALDEAGAFFSRPYGIWSDIAYSRCPDTVAALKKVKRIMDPDNVLNRGKLCFAGEVV